MTTRDERRRHAYRIEWFEGRNAPSRVGLVSAAAEVVHHHRGQAEHARQVHDAATGHRQHRAGQAAPVAHRQNRGGRDDAPGHDAADDRMQDNARGGRNDRPGHDVGDDHGHGGHR
jgi:hypothetical protein